MSAEAAAGTPSARQVATLFFSAFALVGAMSPYMALYFEAWGLSIAQISLLLAVPQLVRLVAPSFWGWCADRAADKGRLLVLGAAGTLLASLLIALAQGSAGWLMLWLAIFHFCTAAHSPIGEAMALRVTAGDAGAYGRVRQWGSIGFILAVAGVGPLLDASGVRWLTLPMALLSLLLLASAWRIARATAPAVVPASAPDLESASATDSATAGGGVQTAAAAAAPGPGVLSRLREPRLALFFLSCALMMFAHAALYGFYSLLLDRQGFSKAGIGLVWTLGVLAEIVLFRMQHRIFGRYGALPLLGFSMAVAAVRFVLIGLGDGHWLLVVLVQLMHAITFGVHHSAAMALLHRWFEPAAQGRAQALYATLGYGLGGAAGSLAAGAIWASAGPAWTFSVAGLAAAAGGLAVLACQRLDRRAAWPVQGAGA
ncbi:MAG: MFS transporter [Burkholderiales bacterium]